MTDYVPAVLPGGGVPLRSAQAFLALAQEVTQQRLVEIVDERRDVSADTSAGPRLSTVADHVAEFAEAERPALTGFELYNAVVYGSDSEGRPWAPRFAAAMVWAVEPGAAETADSPAGHRAVTDEEAGGIRFPTQAFAEAWDPFYTASAALTTGLLGTRPASGSSSAGATTTTTPA